MRATPLLRTEILKGLLWTVRPYCFPTSSPFVVSVAFTAFVSSLLHSQGRYYYSLSFTWVLRPQQHRFNKGRSFLPLCWWQNYISSTNLQDHSDITKSCTWSAATYGHHLDAPYNLKNVLNFSETARRLHDTLWFLLGSFVLATHVCAISCFFFFFFCLFWEKDCWSRRSARKSASLTWQRSSKRRLTHN